MKLPPIPEIFAASPNFLELWNGLSARDQGAVNEFKDRKLNAGELELFCSSVSPDAIQVLSAVYTLGYHGEFDFDADDAIRMMSKYLPTEKVPDFVHNMLDFSMQTELGVRGESQDYAILRVGEFAKTLAASLHRESKLTPDVAIAFHNYAKEAVPDDLAATIGYPAHAMLSNEVLSRLPEDMCKDWLATESPHRILRNARFSMETLKNLVDNPKKSKDVPLLSAILGGVNGVSFASFVDVGSVKDMMLNGIDPYRTLNISADYHPATYKLWTDKVRQEFQEKMYKALSSVAEDLDAARTERPEPDANHRKTQDLVRALEAMPGGYDHAETDAVQKALTSLSYTDDSYSMETLLRYYASHSASEGEDKAAPDWFVDCVERMHRNGYLIQPNCFQNLKVSSAQASRLVHSLSGIKDRFPASEWIGKGTNIVASLSDDDISAIANSDPKLKAVLEYGHPGTFSKMMSDFATADGPRRDHIMDTVQRKMNWVNNSGVEGAINRMWTNTIGQGLVHLLFNDKSRDYNAHSPQDTRRFDMEHIFDYLSNYRGGQFVKAMAQSSGDAVAKMVDRIADNEEDFSVFSAPEKISVIAQVAKTHAGTKQSFKRLWSKTVGKMAEADVNDVTRHDDIRGSIDRLKTLERGTRQAGIGETTYLREVVASLPRESLGKVLKNSMGWINLTQGEDNSSMWQIVGTALKHCSKEDFEDTVMSEPEAARHAVVVCPRRFTPELAEKYVNGLHSNLVREGSGQERFDTVSAINRAVSRLPLPLEFVHKLYDTRDEKGSVGNVLWADRDMRAVIMDKGIFPYEKGLENTQPDSYQDELHAKNFVRPHGPESEALHTFLSKWDKAKQDDEMYLKGHVGGSVEFAFDTAPLRRLRDTIAERSPITRSMHEKEVQKFYPGDWKRFKDNKGMISADSLQAAIDSIPKSMKYNVVHHGFAWGKQGLPEPDYADASGNPDWDRTIPKQRHNEEESKVIRFNITNGTIHKLKKLGLWEAWKHASTESHEMHSDVHPTTLRSSLGWIRWTGHPQTGIFWDECQSDLHSDLRQMAEDPDDEYIDEDVAKRLSNVLFGGKHPSQAFYEAFQQHLRDHGFTDTTIAVHSTDSKARISNAGYTESLDPDAMLYEYDVVDGQRKYRMNAGEKIPVLDENGVHKPDLHARQGLSGIPAPVHMKETYDKIPKKNLAMEPSVYDKRNMPTQSNPHFQGKRQIWQGKNRKSEAYSQTIENMNAGIPLSEDDLLALEDILGYMPPVEKALKFRTTKQFTDEILKPFGWEEPQPGAHWKANHKHGGMWRGFSQSDIANGLDNVRQVYFLNQLGLRHFAVGGEETFGYQPGSELENAYKAWGAPTIDQARAKLQSEISAKKASSALKLQFGKDANVMAVPGVPFENYVPIEKLSHGISDEEIAHPNFQHRVKNVTPGVIPAMEMDGQLVTTNDELLAHARQNGYTHVPVKVEG